MEVEDQGWKLFVKQGFFFAFFPRASGFKPTSMANEACKANSSRPSDGDVVMQLTLGQAVNDNQSNDNADVVMESTSDQAATGTTQPTDQTQPDPSPPQLTVPLSPDREPDQPTKQGEKARRK